jgi:hypothetical protein
LNVGYAPRRDVRGTNDGRSATGGSRRTASALQAKNNVHDALDVIKTLRVQLVRHFDVVVVCSGDFECKACGRKLKELQREVAVVGIVIVCLDMANTSVIVLELTLPSRNGNTINHQPVRRTPSSKEPPAPSAQG